MKARYFDLMKEAILLEAKATIEDCPIKTPNLNSKAKELRELAKLALEEAEKPA